MSYEDDIFKVPWCSDRWELAIKQRTDIAFLGEVGTWVLYRPSRLVVRSSALRDQRVLDAVTRSNADRCEEPAAEVARAIDMELFVTPEDKLVDTVREINSHVPGSASLDHVALPGPHHIHGDDDPEPADDPDDIPSATGMGEGVTVLILDTGCDPTVAALLGITIPAASDDEIVDADGDLLRDPAAGHGTHIAGIVARLAPAATIIPHRLLTTPVGQASDLEVAQALLDFGGSANLINCSFGEGTLDDLPPIIVQDALATLPSSTVVVAAAGNAGLSRKDWPSAFASVLSVGAVGKPAPGDPWMQTDFSNWGDWVDCCAPGVGIVSTFLTLPDQGFTDGYASWTGTSMSAPAVVGTIAALATQDGSPFAGDLPTRIAEIATMIRGLPTFGGGAIGGLVDPAAMMA